MIVFQHLTNADLRRYTTWKTIQQKFFNNVKRESELYYGDVEETRTPFEKIQVQNIEANTKYKVNVNFIYQQISQLLALITKFKPSHRVISKDQDEDSNAFAQAIDSMKYDILYNSDAGLKKKSLLKDFLLIGHGVGSFVEEDFYRQGALNLYFETYHPENFIWDPDCRDESMEGQTGYWVEEEISLDRAKLEYGGLLDALNRRLADPTFTTTGVRPLPPITMEYFCSYQGGKAFRQNTVEGSVDAKTVWVRKFYTKALTTMYLVESKEGVSRIFKENFDDPNLFEMAALKTRAEVLNIFVKEFLYLNDWLIDINFRPTTKYIHKPIFFEWGGKPYISYGLAHFVKDNQMGANSALQMLLLNGMLINNAKWKSPINGIPISSLNDWQDDLADPQKVLFYIPQVYENKVLVPEKDRPEALGNFYPFILDFLINMSATTTGVTPILSGDTSQGKVEVFSSLKQYQTAAMERVRMVMQTIQEFDIRLGNLLIELILNSLQPDNEYLFETEGTDRAFGKFTISAEFLAKLKMASFKLIAIPMEASPAQKIAISESVLNIAQSTPDPVERKIFFVTGLKLAGIREIDEALKKLDTVKQLQGEITQLNEIIKRDKELLKQAENTEIAAKKAARLSEEMLTEVKGILKFGENIKLQQLKEKYENIIERSKNNGESS